MILSYNILSSLSIIGFFFKKEKKKMFEILFMLIFFYQNNLSINKPDPNCSV